MTDIQIKLDSFTIQFKLIEIEDRLPSFKAKVSVNIHQFTRLFNYSEELWFECTSLDRFIISLKAFGETAVLNSMSDEDFILRVSPNSISVNIKARSIDGVTTEFSNTYPLTDDSFSIIKNSFLEFDRWW